MKSGGTAFFKKAGALCLAFAMAIGTGAGISAPEEVQAHHRNYRTSSIILDARNGKIYSEKEADAPRYPASLTKIMTMILVFDAIKAGKINLQTEMETPRPALDVAPSRLGLKRGQHITVKTAISALVVKSANDVAVTLAYNIARSEKSFVRLMNRKAQEIGMAHTHFTNPHGLFDIKQVTTARDMARLARHLINEYPGFYEYFSRQSFEFDGVTYGTHNHLLERYQGMDGIKTGYITASGYNIVSSAEHDGTRLIGVIFGGHSARERDDDMIRLLNEAFNAAAQNRGGLRRDRQRWRPLPALTRREAVPERPASMHP